jgi:large subunit ribosomal protein L30e
MTKSIIKKAVKEGKAIFGYRESLRFIKFNKPKLIVFSKNIPEKFKKSIESHAKINKIKIKSFDGTSSELGTFCGKPFPISVIVIKE